MAREEGYAEGGNTCFSAFTYLLGSDDCGQYTDAEFSNL